MTDAPAPSDRQATFRYPVVLLDVGETLIGPAESFGAVYAQAMKRLGLDLPAEHFERCLRETMAEMDRIVPRGADRYAHFPGGESEYWLHFSQRALEKATGRRSGDGAAGRMLDLLREAFRSPAVWRVYPDVVPVLEGLRADGVRLGVVSNWDSRLPGILEMLELDHYFDEVGVSHLEGLEKPAPEFFLRVLRRLQARPEQALHVGDLPETDLEGARAARIDCLLVDRRGRLDAAFGAVSDLSALPRIAREGLDGPA